MYSPTRQAFVSQLLAVKESQCLPDSRPAGNVSTLLLGWMPTSLGIAGYPLEDQQNPFASESKSLHSSRTFGYKHEISMNQAGRLVGQSLLNGISMHRGEKSHHVWKIVHLAGGGLLVV